MRSDMFKIIVERPRRKIWSKAKGRLKEEQTILSRDADDDYDRIPTTTKIKPHGRSSNRKELNENLKPLINYLTSQIGNSWDDVYSDIRKNLSVRSTMHMHVLVHVKNIVETNTYLGDDGRVYANTQPKPLDEPSPYYGWYRFYVHPETKKLCTTPVKQNLITVKDRYQINDLTQFRRINNVWKVVEFERIPDEMGKTRSHPNLGLKYYKPSFRTDFLSFDYVGDILYPNGIVYYKRQEEYGFANIMVKNIRPLGKREKKILKNLLSKDQQAVANQMDL